jgi:hypothetical protein
VASFARRAARISMRSTHYTAAAGWLHDCVRAALARQLPFMNVTPFSNKGHTMMKSSSLFVAGAAAVLLPLSIAMAQQSTPPQPDPSQPPTQTTPDQGSPDQSAPSQGQGATFESLDTDSDGRISQTEAEANATVKAQFSSYDVNGDGFIERAEVSQANESRSQPQ